VELIRNPGSKYDAETKAVLIIKTKSQSPGISATASERIRVGKYIGDTENIYLTYTKDKFGAYFSYYHGFGKNEVVDNGTLHIYSDTLWSQYISQPYLYQGDNHNFSASFDYSFAKNHAAGMRYEGALSSSKGNLYGNQRFLINNQEEESLTNNTLQKDSPATHQFNAFYEGKFGEKSELRLDMDYVDKNATSNQFTEEESSIPANNRSLHIDSESDFQLAAGKLTATRNLKENSRIELGAEYTVIEGNGFYTHSGDAKKNNIYTNEEEKTAGFISWQTAIQKLQLSLGLRYEYTHEKFTEDSAGTVKINSYYHNIYPNLNVSATFGRVEMSLNANGRTRRPSFAELNSNNLYVNKYMTQRGNPYLKKEDYYEISYNMLYRMLSFSLGYSYVKNPITMSFIEDGNSLANSIITFMNYDKYQKLDFLATIHHTVGFWKQQLTVAASQPFFSTMYRNEKIRRNKANYNLKFTNDFILPGNYIASVYFTYENDYDDYLIRWGGYKKIDLRLRKSFFNESLNLNLYVNDIFNLVKENTYISVDIYSFNLEKKRETRYATLSVQYLFNSTQKRYKGKNAASGDINRL
jgi:hypothetical protein